MVNHYENPPFGEYFGMFSSHQTSKSKVCSFLVTMGVFPNASGERKVYKKAPRFFGQILEKNCLNGLWF